MLSNYLSSAAGSFKRNRFAMIVNIAGLALSLAALLSIAFFIRTELSYDKNVPDHERIYRITEVINSGSYVENSSSLPYPMADAMETDHGDLIEEIAQVFDFQVPVKSFRLENNDLYNEEFIYYADSNVFRFFDIPLISGLQDQVLNDPFQLVVSEDLGKKWFGDESPVGKTVLLAGNEDLRCVITGVYDTPGPSHFKPRAILSMSTLLSIAPGMKKNWVWNPVWTYIKLRPGARIEELEARLPDFIRKHEIPALQNMITLHSQPLSSIHLDSHLEFEMGTNSDRKFIFIFLSCAFFLVVVAVVNFINLTTVTLAGRMKEIGVRKVAGATNIQLVIQFIFESLLLSLISFIAGLIILMLLRPLLFRYFELEISLKHLFDPAMLGIFILIILITGIAAGIYPALVVSRIKIAQFFKGGIRNSRSGKIFRKSLVTIQFGLAVVLIVFTIAAQKQFRFMLEHDNGFKTDNVITMYIGSTELPGKLKEFKLMLEQNAGIESVSIMNEIVGMNNNNHEFRFGDLVGDEFRYIPALMVDEDFVKTMNMKLIAGRDYDRNIQREDSTSVIVNRSATKLLGFENPDDAINQRFSSLSGEEYIIGVVEDFNNKSLHHTVGPFVLDIENRNAYNFYIFAKYAVIRLNDISPEVMMHIENTWKQFVNNAPFDFAMLRDQVSSQYFRESRMNKVLNAFAILSVIIACSGLFALTRILANMKSKELAVRKVLGAGELNLIVVATKEQMSMVALAVMLGVGSAYYIVQQWLSSFAFIAPQELMSFVIAGLIALFVALLTVVFLALKVARQEPAPVLKCE